jgi:hypothetical protein
MTCASCEIIALAGFMVMVVKAKVPTLFGRNECCENLEVYHSQIPNQTGASEHWKLQSSTVLHMCYISHFV